jgi:hypothetical protein
LFESRLFSEKVWEEHLNAPTEYQQASLRQLMIALGILIEGAFCAHLVSGRINTYFAKLGGVLSKFFGLNCDDKNPLEAWNEEM